MSVGDNVDGQAASTVSNFKQLWQSTFFQYTQNITNHISMFTVLGNHDGGPPSYDNGMFAYEQELTMPTSVSGEEDIIHSIMEMLILLF